MPSAEDLQRLQDAIDQVVETTADIETTSNLLRENISYVSVHNANPESHPDIREELTKTPNAIRQPSLSGPLTVESGETNHFTISSTSLLVGVKVTGFKIVKPDNTEIILSGDSVVNDEASFDMVLTGTRFEKKQVTMYAYDELGNVSPYTVVEFTITVNAAPVATTIFCNDLPEYINPGDTVNVQIGGATDADAQFGDTFKYSIENTDLQFSKVSDIIENEIVTITVPGNTPRGTTVPFTIRVTDSKEGSATKTFSIKINQIPVVSEVEVTLPTLINREVAVPFRISGGIDPDGQVLKYSIESTDPNLVFSKTTNIVEFESLTLTVLESASLGSTITFKVHATDTYGATNFITYNKTKINIPPNVDGLVSTLPTIVKPNGDYTFSLSGATDSEGTAIVYDIVCSDLTFDFDKITNITENEEIALHIPSNAMRFSSFTIRVDAKDTLGSVTSKTFAYSINSLVDVSVASIDLPNIIKPNSSYPVKITGVTDTDSQTVTYSISSDDPKLTFSKSSGIAINETITVYTTSDITRGKTITLNAVFTDQLETVSKSFTTKINQLPSTSVSVSLPTIVKPNSTIPLSLSSTDPDSQTVKYSIVSNNAKVTFSKASNISINESFDMVVASDAPRGTTVNLTITISDGLETSSAVKSFKVNTLPSTTLTHNVPTLVAPNTNHTVKFSSTDVDSGQALKYTISSNNAGITFSKNTDIGVNENITMFVSSGITRGVSPELTITISDGLETVTAPVINFLVNTLPDMTSVIINDLPAILKPNTAYPVYLSGMVDAGGSPIKYSISSNNTDVVFSKQSDIDELEVFTITTESDVTRGSTVVFTIVASDGLESNSKTINKVINTLPDLTALSFNAAIPIIIKPNTTYSGVTLSGGTDINGQTVKYAISCDDPLVTFSKYTNIGNSETFDIVVGNVARNKDIALQIVATDGLENTAPVVKYRTINSLPTIDGLTCNIPNIIKPNTSYPIAISGSTDTNGQTLTYAISCANEDITFSKSSNILANESFNLITDVDIVRGTDLTFVVTVSDGLESVTKEFYSKVNTLPEDTVNHDVPPLLIPGNNYTVHLSNTDVDSQTLKYAVSANNAGITFSKNADIGVSEAFTMSVAPGITRGTNIIITVTISDGLESVTAQINTTINTLPATGALVFNNLPTLVKQSTPYSVNISGATDVDGQSLTYSITSDNASVTFSKSSGLTSGEIFTVNFNTIARNTTITFTISVSDGLEVSTKTFTTKLNVLPVVTGLVLNNLPTIVKPSGVYTLNLTGATDADSAGVTYAIASSDPKVTFSKSTNLANSESFDMTVGGTITRNTTITLTVTVSDGLESVTKTFTTLVNTLPVATTITSTIPAIVKPNGSYAFTLNGATDVNGQALTYSISGATSGLTFSKTTGIIAGENITLTTGSLTRNTTVTFDVTVSDGLETSTKTLSYLVNTLPSTALTTSIPGVLIPGNTYTVDITSTDTNAGQTLSYAIASNNAKVTFSKSTGLLVGEDFDILVASDAVRGSEVIFTITVSDGLETASTTVDADINDLPVTTGVIFNNLANIVKPNSTNTVNLTGAADTFGSTLKYSIVSNKAYATFSKSSNLSEGESFTITYSSGAVRGETVTFTVTVTDGLETATKTFTTKINTLPVMSGSTFSLPAIVKPSSTYTGIKLNGMTDVDGQSLTYSIVSDNVGVTFSKSNGLTANESFDVIVGAVARNTTVTFTVTGSDGLETVTKTFTTKINNLPTTTFESGTSIKLPNYLIPNSVNPFTMNGSTDVDGQTLTYAISCDNVDVVFSKSSGIVADESINITVPDTIARNTVLTFTITISDGLETVTNSFTRRINNLPNVTAVVLNNLPTIVKPSSTHTLSLSGATDADTTNTPNQTLNYQIVASDGTNVTFSKYQNLASGETFDVTFGSGVSRNTSITFTVTVSDTYESVTKTFTTLVNSLPVTTSEVINNLPTIIKPDSTTAVNISGATDINGQSLAYSISSNRAYITFSKSSGLASGESFNIIASAAAVRNETITFTVTASDGLETTTKTFTTKINNLPVTTGMTFSLPAIVKPSTTYTGMTLSGMTDVDGQSLTYSITSNNASVTFSKASGLTSGEAFNVVVGAIARNTTVTFTVTGSDGLETVTKTFTTKINNLPVTTGLLVNNLPTVIKPNQTVAINLTGGTDVDSQTLSYSIAASDATNITFSKASGLASGESFNMVVSSGATRGATITLTITVSDGLESSTATKTFKINTLPVLTGLTFSIPSFIKPSATTSGVILSGGTDTDQSLTYTITSDNAGITYSKSTGLTNGEAFNVIAGAITRGTTITFTVTASDGLETTTKTFTTKINQLPSTSVTTTLPTILKPNQTQAITLSSTDPDAQVVTYSITSSDANVTFSKSSGIAVNESFNVIVATGTTRGSTVTLTITISDGLETASTTKTFKVNTLPVTTGIVTTLPAIIKPSSTNAFSISGATDVDSQSLSYSISSSDAKLTFSKSSGITSGESINLVAASDVTRGSTATLTITVSDGLETASTTKTVKINTLPSTTLSETLPAILVPGQTYGTTLNSSDVDSQVLTYSIVSSDANVTFSKSSGITVNESFNIIVGSSVTRGSTITFTVTISDGLETSSTTFTAIINTLPSGGLSGIPALVAPGTTTPITLSGFTDANGSTLTYSIVSNDAKVTFSKYTNIAANESVNMIIASDITRGSTPNVTVYATDGYETVSAPLGVLINVLPNMAGVVFSLPTIVKPSTAYTGMTLSGMVDTTTITTPTYSISCNNASVTFSKSSGLTSGEAFNVTIGAIAENTTLTFTITGSDGVETASTTKTAKINNTPAVTGLVSTIPAIVKPNSTNAFTLSGATDADGQTLSYSVASNRAYATFSKSSGITSGESVNLIVSSAAVRAEVITVTVTVSDGLTTNTKTFTTKVNTLPSTTLTDTLAAVIKPDSTNACQLSSTDVDSQTLSYSITSNKAYITFSKSSGIAVNESFNIIASAAAVRGETVTFTVTISDGLETASTTFTTLINILPVATGIALNNLPTIIKPNSTTAVNLTGGTTGGDSGQTVSYSISSNNGYVTFSKSSGLVNSESFNMVVNSAITRNTTVTLTVTVSDGLESTTKTFTTLVNSLPVVSSTTFNIPAIVKPNSAHSCKVSGITDVNSGSQSLTFSIASSDANVTFSKSSGLINDETFTVTVGTSIIRDTTVTFTITVSDGLETVTKTFTTLVNSLPTATNVVANNLPASTTGSTTPIAINFTGATDTNSGSQTLYYAISGISAGLTFSKTSGILSGESINLTIAKVSATTDMSFTLTISDGLENGTVTKTFTVTVNPIYVIATPTITYPTEGAVLTSDAVTFTFDAINVTVQT